MARSTIIRRPGSFTLQASALAVEDAPPETAAAPGRLWEGTIVVEGVLTGDGRMMEKNALRWDVPLPLRSVFTDSGGHDNAEVVGRVLTIERLADGRIWSTGDFDLGSISGAEAARLVSEEYRTGVSVDLDDAVMEIRVRPEDLPEEDESVAVLPEDVEEAAAVTAAAGEPDDGERETLIEISSDSEVLAITSGRIRAATLVDIPAFSEAHIAPRAGDETPPAETEEDQVPAMEASLLTPVTASGILEPAAPAAPPTTWFADPGLTEPTPLTVTGEGRVFGHIAAWGTCHIGFADQCVQPPESAADYAYFATGMLSTEDGSAVAVGTITMDTLHAGPRETARSTLAHYEDTGAVAAFISVGQDAHGIWCAGALRSDLPADSARTLKASPLSGDWREIRGHLELVGVLAVNVPGFPLPRTKALAASGAMGEAMMTSLVAAGMIPPRKVLPPGTPGAFSDEDLRYLKTLAARERQAQTDERAAKARGLRARVLRSRVAAGGRK